MMEHKYYISLILKVCEKNEVIYRQKTRNNVKVFAWNLKRQFI